MANIKNELNNIKGALYGKDVRSSIHDGIDAINKEVESTTNRQEHLEGTFDQLIINSGNSNAEIVDARVGENGKSYAKLGDRLDEVDSQLEQNINDINKIRKDYSELNPSFCIVDDDCTEKVYSILKPLLDKKGVKKATIAIPTKLLDTDGFMSKNQVKELINNGWEGASHSVNHVQLQNLDDNDLDWQLKESKRFINEELDGNCKHIFYPFGKYNSKVISYTKKYYESGISTPYARNIRPVNTYAINRCGIGSYEPSPGMTIDDFKNIIDTAITNKEMLVFMTHIAETSDENISRIEAIIDYVHSKGYSFETYDEAYQKHKNIIDIGEYIQDTGSYHMLGADGGIINYNCRVVTESPNSHNGLHMPDNFRKNCITINQVGDSVASSSNLPKGIGGFLTTYYLSLDPIYCYQEYKPRTHNKTYQRRMISYSAWGEWESVNNSNINNDVSATTRIGAFVLNEVTFSEIKNTNATGFPTNKGGTLITFRISNDLNCSYQLYLLQETNAIYSRKWDINTDSWQDWKSIGDLAVDSENHPTSTDSWSSSCYPDRQVTYHKIFNSGAAGYPESKGGVLMTNKTTPEKEFTYQEYVPVRSYKKYIRHVNDDSTWTEWVQL